MVKKIAFYGKGGIGKSIICQNTAAAAAELGHRVMVIGCDPKCDSTLLLTHGKNVETILEILQKKDDLNSEDLLIEGYKGIFCIEVGGPRPGIGCAGRGIIVAVQALKKLKLFDIGIDLVIYDVPGDIVCGGFAVPIRNGYSEEIYIITSGEYLSILAANNICKGIKEIKANLAGIIGNSRSPTDEFQAISNFSEKIGSPLISYMPYSDIIKKCERKMITVFEFDLENELTNFFKDLAEKILDNKTYNIPDPLSNNELRKLFDEG